MADGIKSNSSIKVITFLECALSIDANELFISSCFKHVSLEYLDYSRASLNDDSAKQLARVIDCQCERRDNVVWMHALRNEVPKGNDYTKGLALINLNGNKITEKGAEKIAEAISKDTYLRAINLSNNNIDEKGCKSFIYALRKNKTMLNIDLTGNPGYTDNVKKRLTLKLIENIKSMRAKGYTGEDLAFYSQFIDYSLFDVEIPETVVEWYKTVNGKESKLEKAREEKKLKKRHVVKKEAKEEKKTAKIIREEDAVNTLEDVRRVCNDLTVKRSNYKGIKEMQMLLQRLDEEELRKLKLKRDNLSAGIILKIPAD